MKRCSASPGAGQMVRQILAYPGGNRLLILGQKIASLSPMGNVSLYTSAPCENPVVNLMREVPPICHDASSSPPSFPSFS
jgi:hypothetical protein